MKKALIASLFTSLSAVTGAQAAAPVATQLTPGLSFEAYSGAPRIGSGSIDDNDSLYWVKEAAVDGLQAWTLFYDPTRVRNLSGTITFDQAIAQVITTRAGLRSSNATYGIDVDGDGRLNDYANQAAMGLENNDSLSWISGTKSISLQWRSADNGDQIRVLTAVPEPSTYALLALGLGAMGLLLRSRRPR